MLKKTLTAETIKSEEIPVVWKISLFLKMMALDKTLNIIT